MQMKTEVLRRIVTTLLDQVPGKTYYDHAPDDAVFPYKVYSFESIDLNDLSRDDLVLIVDLWDRGESTGFVESIADQIENELNNVTVPKGGAYPTFFRISRKPLADENKQLQHRQLRFAVQNYYVGG